MASVALQATEPKLQPIDMQLLSKVFWHERKAGQPLTVFCACSNLTREQREAVKAGVNDSLKRICPSPSVGVLFAEPISDGRRAVHVVPVRGASSLEVKFLW